MAKYFTEQEFKEEMDLDRIADVLNRLYKEEDVSPEQEYSIEFFMMSDSLEKLDEIEEVIEEMGGEIDSSEQHEDGCELIAMTAPMKMDVETVKAWYTKLWKDGYAVDCKLDGWHALVD